MIGIDVSIIIINYKTPELLFSCIKSIYEYSALFSFEIIVVDNDSQDDSKRIIKDYFNEVIWVDAGSNLGFGAANNIGIEMSVGEYTLLLNSDTELYENVIFKSLEFYKEISKDKNIGLLGCRIEHRNKKLQPSCNYYWAGLKEEFQANPIAILIRERLLKLKKLRGIDKYAKLGENHEITWLGFPFAFIKSEIIKENLFDTNFFMYSEDEELNYRLSQKGYIPYYYSEAGVYHIIGGSSSDNFKRNRQIFASKLLFILKIRGKAYLKLYILILKLNIKLDNLLNPKNEVLINQNKLKLSWLKKYTKVILSKEFTVLNTYLD
jgi:GT2 family glycosyltransferase